MTRIFDIVLLLLVTKFALSGTVVKRNADGNDGETSTGDNLPALDMENGRLTDDELKLLEKIQSGIDTHADGIEAQMMELQRICEKFEEDTEANGEQPAITDENKHCVENINTGTAGRKKRSYIYKDAGKWTKCIVPYEIDYSTIPDENVESVINNIITAQKYYETYTGFRFVPHFGDNSFYGLDHPNFLRFIYQRGSCWSYVGRWSYFGTSGQPISSCGGLLALHEIGHALGMEHEQQNPNSFSWMTVEYNNILPNYVQYYLRDSVKRLWNENATYDMGSLMHYALWGFRIPGTDKTMSAYDVDLFEILRSTSNSFYVFRDLQLHQNCLAEFEPCPESMVCHNDGYKSIILGKCACRCPPGFDSKTNCATKGYSDVLWPGGTYSLLKTQSGSCPNGFEEGRMVQWSHAAVAGSSSYHHSPAIWDTSNFILLAEEYKEIKAYIHYSRHMYGGLLGASVHEIDSSSTLLAHDVCTKTYDWEGDITFPKGKYCVLRTGGFCPTGFTEGIRQTYGAAKPAGATESNSGVLPDGEHGRLFDYLFCCRQDGYGSTPRNFPYGGPFILYSTGPGCQKVIGMTNHPVEYYTFENDPSFISLNVSGSIAGTSSTTESRFNVNFCYYEPYNTDCGIIKTFADGEMTYTFMTPNHPNSASEGYRCMWHFTSPAGTTMQLDFEDFNIPPKTNSEKCKDDHFIELKFIRPGSSGVKFCANTYKKTQWTTENFLTVHYTTAGTSGRGFKATVSVIKDEDHCYHGDGSDGSYQGPVHYTKSFAQCASWSDTTNCRFHQFESRVMDGDLTGNQCRNVGLGTSPWCYTNTDTCERQYCDACMSGTCFDVLSTCDSTHCNTAQGLADCMETCGLCTTHQKMSSVTCGPPGSVKGITPTPIKTTYNVGETVTYTCSSQPSLKKTRVCTSEATWSNLNFVCGSCPSGYSVFNRRCYKWLGYKTYLPYSEALAKCSADGAILARVDSQAVQDWIFKILDYDLEEKGLDAWLGMTADSSGTWRWGDGTTVGPYTNWKSGEPGNSLNCVIMRQSDGKWEDKNCNTFDGNVVCEFLLEGADDVHEDQIPNCSEVLANTPDMCTQWPDYAWHNCRKKCGL